MLLITICLAVSTLTDNPNYQEGIQFGEKIMKQQLKQKMASLKGGVENKKILKLERCQTMPEIKPDPETSLYVFMSFSIPEEAWLALSEELIRTDGVMILRGLPSNSFKELGRKIKTLRSRGMKAPVHVDPMLFDRFGVKSVPAFVKIKDESFDKICGNISLAYALEKIE